jgi:hypothetical protein
MPKSFTLSYFNLHYLVFGLNYYCLEFEIQLAINYLEFDAGMVDLN